MGLSRTLSTVSLKLCTPRFMLSQGSAGSGFCTLAHPVARSTAAAAGARRSIGCGRRFVVWVFMVCPAIKVLRIVFSLLRVVFAGEVIKEFVDQLFQYEGALGVGDFVALVEVGFVATRGKADVLRAQQAGGGD